ncbi:MAG: hypothetical protein AAGU04_00980 [Anaerolineaceae bacterium]
MVTGDRRLNELAKAQEVPVHGVLWILDEMVIHHVLTATQAAFALREMLDQGASLPDGECQKRFDHWTLWPERTRNHDQKGPERIFE